MILAKLETKEFFDPIEISEETRWALAYSLHDRKEDAWALFHAHWRLYPSHLAHQIHLVVSYREGQRIGWSLKIPSPDGSEIITRTYVSPAYRNKRLGTLLARLIQHTREIVSKPSA